MPFSTSSPRKPTFSPVSAWSLVLTLDASHIWCLVNYVGEVGSFLHSTCWYALLPTVRWWHQTNETNLRAYTRRQVRHDMQPKSRATTSHVWDLHLARMEAEIEISVDVSRRRQLQSTATYLPTSSISRCS